MVTLSPRLLIADTINFSAQNFTIASHKTAHNLSVTFDFVAVCHTRKTSTAFINKDIKLVKRQFSRGKKSLCF